MPDEQLNNAQTERRRDDALRRAMNTPPTPHKPKSKPPAPRKPNQPAKRKPRRQTS